MDLWIEDGYLRFESDDIRYPLALVSLGIANLTDCIHEQDTSHPLIGGELHLTGKVMHMLDQRRENESRPVRSLGANGIENIVCKVGIVLGGSGRHVCYLAWKCELRSSATKQSSHQEQRLPGSI